MRSDTHLATGESTKPAPFRSPPREAAQQPRHWTFRPDITPSNIRAKLPENHSNSVLSGRNALLINRPLRTFMPYLCVILILMAACIGCRSSAPKGTAADSGSDPFPIIPPVADADPSVRHPVS